MPTQPATSRWHPTDDAGKPLPQVSSEVFTHAVWDGRPSTKQKWLKILTWLFFPALAVWACIDMLYRGVSLPTWQQVLPGAIWAVGFALFLRFQQRTTGTPRLPPGVAWVAAHRHCGACGYRLHEVEPDHLGLAQCPECGASWHRDRWTLADRDLRAALDARTPMLNTFASTPDDRGVWLNGEPTWPPRWFDGAPHVAEANAIVHQGDQIRDRRVRIATVMLLVAWLCATAFIVWHKDPLPRDRFGETVFIGVVLGLIALVLWYLVRRASITWSRQRALTLAAGLCPACGKRLPAAPVAFDDCRACTCGRAWKPA